MTPEPGSADLARLVFPALGCLAVLAVTDVGALGTVRAVVDAELDRVDAACSRFRPDSALSRANDSAGARVPAPALLTEAVAVALRAAKLTDGLVDPTLGRQLAGLGYDRDFAQLGGTTHLPPVRVRRVGDWRDVELGEGWVRVPAGSSLDLGATAKAWAADRCARLAARAAPGVGVLVSLGGDVAVAGLAPRGGWPIRIGEDAAEDPERGTGPVVRISDGGLATSGTAVRQWVRAGSLLHHLLDPRTGLPARTPWRTVSVAAGSCTDANVASTAAVLWGRAAPGELGRRHLPARLVAEDGSITLVGGWPQDAVRGAA
ncbi:MAG: FAD:protein FMN transferase [Mycobacteriales bacterium]